MNKVIVSVTVALGLTACATNEFDAQIAVAEEKAYQASVEAAYKPVVLCQLCG
jgi:hypothetical protein